jgi:hypothetical protein
LLLVLWQGFARNRADALSRVGSKSAVAELISQLLLWARASSWLPQPLLACILELAAGDPDGERAELVLGAFQFLQQLSKVKTAGLQQQTDVQFLQAPCSTTDMQQASFLAFKPLD